MPLGESGKTSTFQVLVAHSSHVPSPKSIEATQLPCIIIIQEVCNAIGAHHDEVEMTSLIAPLIQVCDGVSGARPGARRAMTDQYIKRIKELEETALGYPGVLKSYAIQAGRELRVVVESEKVTDEKASELAFQISDKIQNEMTYPGQVKVTVIRETRAISYAK